jgi:hypothetical protein
MESKSLTETFSLKPAEDDNFVDLADNLRTQLALLNIKKFFKSISS